MQRTFHIELRVTYQDKGKDKPMEKAIVQGARHMLGAAKLLADGIAPQIVVYSDDFYGGHEEISLLDAVVSDEVALGIADESQVSDELLELARQRRGEQR